MGEVIGGLPEVPCYNSGMDTINSSDFLQNPHDLLDRVAAGERLVVMRDGHAIAEIRPLASGQASPRPFGLCAGEFEVPDDFDAPLPSDILEDFEGV